MGHPQRVLGQYETNSFSFDSLGNLVVGYVRTEHNKEVSSTVTGEKKKRDVFKPAEM